MNSELFSLFAADQRDHSAQCRSNEPQTALRDQERIASVRTIFRHFAVLDAADLYHAAVIYSRGTDRNEKTTAVLLARRSADAGYAPARELLARLTADNQPT